MGGGAHVLQTPHRKESNWVRTKVKKKARPFLDRHHNHVAIKRYTDNVEPARNTFDPFKFDLSLDISKHFGQQEQKILQQTSIDYSSYYSTKIFTSGSMDKYDLQEAKDKHGLRCGFTNQIYEAVNALALSIRLGAKKFALPRFCVNGNWGLCACNRFSKASSLFDVEFIKSHAKMLWDIDIIEELADYDSPSITELINNQNYTLYQRSLDEAVEYIHNLIQTEKSQVGQGKFINLGYTFGKWRAVSKQDEKLYLNLFNLFQPSTSIRKLIDDTMYKMKDFDGTNHLFVIHTQFANHEGVYLGCQRSSFQPLIYEVLPIPPNSSVLLVSIHIILLTKIRLEVVSRRKIMKNLDLAEWLINAFSSISKLEYFLFHKPTNSTMQKFPSFWLHKPITLFPRHVNLSFCHTY